MGNTYGINKLVSIGIPMGVLLGVTLFGSFDSPFSWWVLIVIAHTLGYTHFILGFVYQARSVQRQADIQRTVLFILLTTVATCVSIAAALYDVMSLLSIFAIGYFIFHGAMNESTLMLKQFGYSPGLKFMLPIGLYILPFFLLALPHPSFFFTPQLFFLNPTPTIAMEWLNGVVDFNLLQLVAFGCLAAFLVAVPGQLMLKQRYLAAAVITVAVFLTARLFIDVYPLNYIVLYFLFLTYHFISWSLYFYQSFRHHAPARIPAYVRDHLVILIPLILISVGSVFNDSALLVQHAVFNGGLFVTCAMIHNTTSLLNEDWVSTLLKVLKNDKK